MKTKKLFIISSIVIISLLFIIPNFILAAEGDDTKVQSTKTEILNNVQSIGNEAGYAEASDDTLVYAIAKIINIVLSLLGIIFLILILLSGFQWMTAQGNEDMVKKAKARMKNAIIGLVIIILSYTISNFISLLFWHSIDNSVVIPL